MDVNPFYGSIAPRPLHLKSNLPLESRHFLPMSSTVDDGSRMALSLAISMVTPKRYLTIWSSSFCGCKIGSRKVAKNESVVPLDKNSEGIDAHNVEISIDGDAYRSTLRLVECAMFAAVTGLVYYLSNSLAIENYFGCFFSLPIVISSMRWGLAAGRKTMVATAMLLLTLSGPLKACTYLLMHGFVGLAMGSLWRLGANWLLSIIFCTLVRATGALGYVLISSILLRENILALIAINLHASLSYMLAALGVNIIPSMKAIYTIFGSLLLLNCGFFVFLLHMLYAVFLSRLGMRFSLTLPGWLEKAL